MFSLIIYAFIEQQTSNLRKSKQTVLFEAISLQVHRIDHIITWELLLKEFFTHKSLWV